MYGQMHQPLLNVDIFLEPHQAPCLLYALEFFLCFLQLLRKSLGFRLHKNGRKIAKKNGHLDYPGGLKSGKPNMHKPAHAKVLMLGSNPSSDIREQQRAFATNTYQCQIRIDQQFHHPIGSCVLLPQQIHLFYCDRPHISVFTVMHVTFEQFPLHRVQNACQEHLVGRLWLARYLWQGWDLLE